MKKKREEEEEEEVMYGKEKERGSYKGRMSHDISPDHHVLHS